MNKPKIRSSVSVVKLNDNVVEFFLTNTRKQVRIKLKNIKLLDLILSLDGRLTFEAICQNYNMDEETKIYFYKFLKELEKRSIIRDNDFNMPDDYYKYRRVFNFLDDFSESYEHMVKMWNNLKSSTVVIIGLGGVGTWVASTLLQSGIQSFILIDNDVVEETNLNRQFGFNEDDIGLLKTDALEKRLKSFNNDIKVKKINKFLDENVLYEYIDNKVDLVINCADNPNVDTTSLWVGEFCMDKNIPHIIGGGYNLHSSLIGQTIIPYKSACIKCFAKELNKINQIDESKLKKLSIKNRKIGSFGPMCSIIASMIVMEAVKILSKSINPSNLNRRGEFDIYTMDIKYHNVQKDEDCEWCGRNGKYYEKYRDNGSKRE